MGLRSKLRKGYTIWARGGVAGVIRRIEWNRARSGQHGAYKRWLRMHSLSSEDERAAMYAKIADFAIRPLISVLLPVYNIDEKWLRLCIDSVKNQIYPDWELCIADDHSSKSHIRRVLDEYAAGDARIKVSYRRENGHISAASNSALELATGDFTVLLDHDDELSIDALFWVANELTKHPDTAMIYSDEDMVDTRGNRSQPNFKPDFSYDLLLSVNLVTHLSGYRTELLKSIGGFRLGLEGSQDYDLALRVIEQISHRQIRHIPRILYHWRTIEGSVALNSDEKPYAHERARIAIREHLERTGQAAEVVRTQYNFHRVRPALTDPLPRVSVIVDTRSPSRDIARIVSNTDYPTFEIIAVARQAGDKGLELVGPEVQIAFCEDRRRAARLNFGVRQSSGEICIFTGEGLIPRSKDWLSELIRFCVREEIGAVGGKVLSPDATVLDGGLIVDIDRGAAPAHQGFPDDFAGMTARNVVIGNFSAVSEACLAVRRKDFDLSGGFDEQNLPDALFAADLCMKLGDRGLRIVSTPYAELLRPNAAAQVVPSDSEVADFKKRWPRQTAFDPFYNPNLSKRDGKFLIDI